MSQSLRYEEAVDDMCGMFNDGWTRLAPVPLPRLEWEDLGQLAPPPSQDETWARFSLRHQAPQQLPSLGGRPVAKGGVGRIYSREGIVTVQVFAVLTGGDGRQAAARLARTVQEIFEGNRSPKGIQFPRVQIVEIGVDRQWYNVNTLAYFQYDELK